MGIVDHVSIGSGATIGAAAGVMKDVPPGETHVGIPAAEIRQTLRQWAATRKLPDWMQQASQVLKVRQHEP